MMSMMPHEKITSQMEMYGASLFCFTWEKLRKGLENTLLVNRLAHREMARFPTIVATSLPL